MTLRKKFLSRISFFSFLFLLIFSTGAAASFLFTSCTNLFEENLPGVENQTAEGESNQNGAETSEVTADGQLDGANGTASSEASLQPITITGQICLTGALPEFFLQSDSTNPSDRSALPSYTTSEVQYFAFATSVNQTINASFDTGASATTFTLALIPNHNWTITCGLKTATTPENVLLSTTSEPFNPTNLPTGQTLKFFPVPDTSTGTGQIDLSISLDSSINSVRLRCIGSNSASWPAPSNPSDFITISGNTATIKATTGSTIENVTSGLYEVMISFYDSSNALLYATVQNITVCKGMTTRVWVASGGDSPIDSNGVFEVTSAKIQGFASTNYFVAAAPLGAEGDGFVAPADTNIGSHKAPFATLGRALTQIANYGNSTKDYKIHISGLQKVASTATSGFSISGLDSKMNSLTISGLNNNTTDILDGDHRFCTLKIDSTKNVTIQNLTIRNGNAQTTEEANGGGIGKYKSGELHLENCIVTDNTATNAGGGFCSFENAGDCTIKNCHFESNSAGSNGGGIYSRAKTLISNTEIIDNTATTSGGGCYFRDKDVTISGSQTRISNNRATNSQGGGICVATNNSLVFKEGTIFENVAQLLGGGIYSIGPVTMTSGIITGNQSLNDTDCLTAGVTENERAGGGGVCVKNTFTMSGGIISGNKSGFYGGGIILITSNSKVILSGTAVIGDISKTSPSESGDDKHSNSANKGGGIFNYGGKLYIGYIDETTPDSSFSGGIGYNYVSVHGGGVYSIGSTSAEVHINKAKIYANTAGTSAGGIDIYNGSFEIKNSEVKYNKSANGGGLQLGRNDGSPTCLIQNTNIQNNIANSNGGGIYLFGGNTTLIDTEISNNQADVNGGGIFFNTNLLKSLILGTNSSASTVIVKNNTEGTSTPYSKSNVYLNATDYITIAGELNTESEIGIKKASLPIVNAFTAGFKSKNPSITPADIFTSDENNYDVGANLVTGEAKLRISGSAGPALTWYYAAGDACMLLSAADIESLGLPEYHNISSGTSFVLNRTSTGPFYDAETGDDAIFTGNIRIQNPASGTLVTAGTETSTGIPYTIAADAINSPTFMYIMLDIGTVYLDPVEGDDDNGGWNKDIPVKTVAQAKRILKGNTKTNPAIKVMNTISDASEITALNNLTIGDGGSVSDYNGAIVKRQASFVSSEMLNISSNITLQNVTLDGGAVWTSSAGAIEANPDLLTARANATSNNGVKEGKYLISVNGSPTMNYVTIQNCDNSTNGAYGNGAAMYIASGTVTLNNCAIKDCSSVGGAVYATINGILNATNTHFRYNLSKGTGTSYGNGGAVVLYGATSMGAKATFNNCSFRYNAALRNGGAISAGNKTSVTFENMGSALIEHNSAAGNGDFMWSAASNLKLLGDFAFGTSPNQVDFYINNSGSDLKIQLGSGFGSGTTGQALIYLAKSFEESINKVILAPVSDDTTVNIATAKSKFALAGTDAELYEINDNGKISPLASGGNMYTAMDYVITLSADKSQVTQGQSSLVTITPTVKRTEANGSQTDLYYNPVNQKLYTDSAFNTLAAGDNTISWSALLMCGTDIEYPSLTAGTGAASNQFTIPALDWEDTYSLNVTVTFMGLASDTSFTLQCVEGD